MIQQNPDRYPLQGGQISPPAEQPDACALKRFLACVGVCWACCGVLAGGAALPFRHVVVDANGPSHPHCKTVGDVDGDGLTDLLAGGAENGGVVWYANPSWSKHRIDQGSFSTDMQVGDVDRDGDLDVIIPKLGVGLVWYENPRPAGNPARDQWKMHVISAGASVSLQRDDFHHDVEVGDINGDGKLDVVTRGGRTRIFLQNNPDSWATVVIPTDGRGGLALADLNADGLLDIVENGYWLECPKDPGGGTWVRHEIASGWPDDVGVTVADINGDGRPDVLLAPAERPGRLAWFEAPAQLPSGRWIEHVIASDVADIHTFKVADMDGDKQLDVVTAEMEQSPQKRISIYFNEGRGEKWRQQVVGTTGSHNLRVARIGRGNTLSIVGSNHGNNGAPPVIDLWENVSGEPAAKTGLSTRP